MTNSNTPNERNRGSGSPVNGVPRPPVSIELGGNDRDYDDVTELFLGEGSAVPASKVSSKSKSISEPLRTFKFVGRPEDFDEADERNRNAEVAAFDAITPAGNPETVNQIEAVVQGHLPVFASAWVTQYAKSRAEELKRAVVLIRMREGFSSVECVLPGGTPAMSMAPSPSIEGAIELARGMGAKNWIIQTDEPNEPSLWRMPGVTRITILTGADRVAVMSCFRVLKGISQAIGPESAIEIHAAILGATAENATEAISQLKTAGQELLGRQVGGSIAAAKIGAGAASSLYQSNEDTTPLESVIVSIGESPVADSPTAAPETVGTRAEAVQREMAAMRASLLMGARSESLQFTETVATPIDDQPAEARGEPAEAKAHQGSQAADVVGPAIGADSQQTRPSSLIELIDDVERLDIECPAAGGVEFGIAQDGRMHLISHVDGEPNSGHPSTQSRAVEDLLVAAAWATSHARLLLGANPTMRLDARDHAPILHVVTSKPREARRLLDTNIRVHLVIPPHDENRWISLELN